MYASSIQVCAIIQVAYAAMERGCKGVCDETKVIDSQSKDNNHANRDREDSRPRFSPTAVTSKD